MNANANANLTDDELRDALSRIADWGTPAEAPALDDLDHGAATVLPMPVRRPRRAVWWASAAALIIAIALVARSIGGESHPLPRRVVSGHLASESNEEGRVSCQRPVLLNEAGHHAPGDHRRRRYRLLGAQAGRTGGREHSNRACAEDHRQ